MLQVRPLKIKFKKKKAGKLIANPKSTLFENKMEETLVNLINKTGQFNKNR